MGIAIQMTILSKKGRKAKIRNREGDLPGRAPLIAKQTVRIVISVLSAIGSMTVPTTVCNRQCRAM